ncbi:hypothetical protein GOODEAATRI_024291, partial [Goodea atripinnis]
PTVQSTSSSPQIITITSAVLLSPTSSSLSSAADYTEPAELIQEVPTSYHLLCCS